MQKQRNLIYRFVQVASTMSAIRFEQPQKKRPTGDIACVIHFD
jgi:hypothetical protein